MTTLNAQEEAQVKWFDQTNTTAAHEIAWMYSTHPLLESVDSYYLSMNESPSQAYASACNYLNIYGDPTSENGCGAQVTTAALAFGVEVAACAEASPYACALSAATFGTAVANAISACFGG